MRRRELLGWVAEEIEVAAALDRDDPALRNTLDGVVDLMQSDYLAFTESIRKLGTRRKVMSNSLGVVRALGAILPSLLVPVAAPPIIVAILSVDFFVDSHFRVRANSVRHSELEKMSSKYLEALDTAKAAERKDISIYLESCREALAYARTTENMSQGEPNRDVYAKVVSPIQPMLDQPKPTTLLLGPRK